MNILVEGWSRQSYQAVDRRTKEEICGRDEIEHEKLWFK